MNGAAYNGHLEVVRWLHENRTEVKKNLHQNCPNHANAIFSLPRLLNYCADDVAYVAVTAAPVRIICSCLKGVATNFGE